MIPKPIAKLFDAIVHSSTQVDPSQPNVSIRNSARPTLIKPKKRVIKPKIKPKPTTTSTSVNAIIVTYKRVGWCISALSASPVPKIAPGIVSFILCAM